MGWDGPCHTLPFTQIIINVYCNCILKSLPCCSSLHRSSRLGWNNNSDKGCGQTSNMTRVVFKTLLSQFKGSGGYGTGVLWERGVVRPHQQSILWDTWIYIMYIIYSACKPYLKISYRNTSIYWYSYICHFITFLISAILLLCTWHISLQDSWLDWIEKAPNMHLLLLPPSAQLHKSSQDDFFPEQKC